MEHETTSSPSSADRVTTVANADEPPDRDDLLDASEAARDLLCEILDSTDVTLPAALRDEAGRVHERPERFVGRGRRGQ